jgi:hypothetical protein
MLKKEINHKRRQKARELDGARLALFIIMLS